MEFDPPFHKIEQGTNFKKMESVFSSSIDVYFKKIFLNPAIGI